MHVQVCDWPHLIFGREFAHADGASPNSSSRRVPIEKLQKYRFLYADFSRGGALWGLKIERYGSIPKITPKNPEIDSTQNRFFLLSTNWPTLVHTHSHAFVRAVVQYTRSKRCISEPSDLSCLMIYFSCGFFLLSRHIKWNAKTVYTENESDTQKSEWNE